MRIYLIATLLVALLAMSGIVSAGDTALVDTEVADAFEVTSAAPATIIAPAIPGTAGISDVAPVVVNSNVNWDLGISGTDAGDMINGATPAQNPLKVNATATTPDWDWHTLTGDDLNILSDQNYGAAIEVPVKYNQTFGYDDKAGSYAITVTWSIVKHV